jgi:hypothetical protein
MATVVSYGAAEEVTGSCHLFIGGVVKTVYLIHGERDKEVILKSVLHNALHQKAHIVKPQEVIYLS